MINKILIGIDPGVKTGLAVWRSCDNAGFYLIDSCGIIDAMSFVVKFKEQWTDAIFVYIENPNLRKWYGPRASQKQQGAGSIKRDYAIWLEFLQHHGIAYQEVAPKNVLTKLDAKTFASLTGWQGKTNEHSRDAAMLVYGK